MPSTRGAFSQLLAPGLMSVIYNELSMHPEEYSQLFNVLPTSRAYEEDQLIAGLGAVPAKPEGQQFYQDQPIQGGSYRYTVASFGLAFQVTREMWDDDQYSIMKKVSTDFAGSIRQTIEVNAAGVLINSFSSASAPTITVDGVSLINTAHPLLGGGTYSNASATNVAFSVTGVQEAILIFEKTVNERGLLKRMVPSEAWGPVDIQFIMQEVLHSSYKPYSGNNEVNSVQGRLIPKCNHYLSSTTAWWATAEKSGHTLKFFWRTQPEFDRWDDNNTKGANFSCFFRQTQGATYWHGIYGSPGQ
jgi:hypothetical protein